MRKLIGILTLILLITGCDKDNHHNNVRLVLKMSYHSSGTKSFEKATTEKSKSNDFYTQFGDFITSVSPTGFIGKFLDMRLFNFDEDGTIWNYGFNIIDNNTPLDSINRLADFINQSRVDFNLNPNIIPAGSDGVFNIFVFIPLYFYQEFELPVQYETILSLPYLEFGNNNTLNNFDGHWIGGNRTGLLVKGSGDPLLAPIFDSNWTGFNGDFPPLPKNFVFGSCDSTYIYYSSISHQLNIDNPLGQEGYIIRSNAFDTITIPMGTADETKIVTGSMTFDTHNLIQICAGADNVPYTSDDVFVYAPNFWERFSVIMTTNQAERNNKRCPVALFQLRNFRFINTHI